MTKAAGVDMEFRFHPLFRDFLRAKLAVTESAHSIGAIHLRAAAAMENRNQWDQAVRHFSAADSFEAVASIIERVGPAHLEAALFDMVMSWIELLPDHLLRRRPAVLLQKGRILHMQAEFDAAMGTLKEALALYRSAEDVDGVYNVATELGLLHTRIGGYRDGAALLDELAADQRLQPIQRADILRAHAANLRELGDVVQSVDRAQQALEIARDFSGEEKSTQVLMRVSRTLGFCYLVQGCPREAVALLRDTLRVVRGKQDNDIDLGWTWIVLGTALYCDGEFERALDAFAAGEALNAGHIATQRDWIRTWRGCLYRDQGLMDAAERELGECGTNGMADLALVRLQQRDTDEALRLARTAFRARDKNEYALDRSRSEGTLAVVYARLGQHEAADAHFRRAEASLIETGCGQRLASLQFHMAAWLMDRGDQEGAVAVLMACLPECARHAYRHFFWWDRTVTAKICALALSKGIEPDYVRELALGRLGRDEVVHFAALKNSQSAGVRQWALAVTQGLSDGAAVEVDLASLLADCDNPRTRKRLEQNLLDGAASAACIERLRKRYGLTWKELEVFVLYYIAPSVTGRVAAGQNLRKTCAEQLFISENTVRAHIKNIRLKMELPGETGSAVLREWLRAEGLTV